MGRSKFKALTGLHGRQFEDELYRIVSDEISSGYMDNVAQARSIEEANGDRSKLEALYLKHRIRRIKDEIVSAEIKAEEDKKARDVQLKREAAVDAQRRREDALREEHFRNERRKEEARRHRQNNRRWIAHRAYGFLIAAAVFVILSIII